MAPARATRTSRGRGERGQATVELALVLPVVALLLLLLAQGALVARDALLVAHASRVAAREASVGAPADAVRAAARRVLPTARVRVTRTGGVGAPIRVEVVDTVRTDLPLVGPLLPDPTLRSSTVMRRER